MENSVKEVRNHIVFDSDGEHKVSLKNENYDHIFNIQKNQNITLYLSDISSNILINVNDGAYLKLLLIIDGVDNNINLDVKCKKEATFECVFGDFANSNTTFNSKVDLLGEESKGEVIFSAVSNDRFKKHYVCNFNHFNVNTESNLKAFGVSLKNSEISIKGDSYIPKNAVKSRASQDAKIILFDKESRGIASPILKIECDDIKANHACSIGSINEEHLYYLMSRGLDIETVRKLIVLGYITPIKAYFNDEVKEYIDKFIGRTF